MKRLKALLRRAFPRSRENRNIAALHGKYLAVFGSEIGQEVLAHICKTNFVFDCTFVAGDPYHTAMHEGQRRAALSIVRFCEKDPDSLNYQNETPAQS